MNDSEVKECRICLEDEDDESKLIYRVNVKAQINMYINFVCINGDIQLMKI